MQNNDNMTPMGNDNMMDGNCCGDGENCCKDSGMDKNCCGDGGENCCKDEKMEGGGTMK